ncbi:MAG: site-specific DNA-methyltransferase [Candidatus Puniceispirillaceae bacterium]
MKQQIEYVETSKLVPYARNSRTHSDEQVAQICGSIKEFGFTNPVLIDADGIIIAGHGRTLAAQRLDMKEVPCLRLDYLTEAQKKAYVIADNKLALNAGWDEEMLALELSGLKDSDFDLSLTGFNEDEIEVILRDDSIDEDGLIDDDDAPGLEDDAVSKNGDVWILDDHRVMCGDSTNISDVDVLTDQKLCDACWTDPPYNVAYEGSNGMTIKNDSMKNDDFYNFLYDSYVAMFSAMKEGAAIYVAHADTEGLNFRLAFREAGFKLSGCLIWVKESLVLGRSDYQWRHEPILYGWKKGAAHKWYSGRKNTTVLEQTYAPYNFIDDNNLQIDLGKTSLVVSGEGLEVDEVQSTIIKVAKPKRNSDHPTMKPVDLIVGMLKNSTKRGDCVLDLFGGSGSTLIACQKTGRSSRLMELDPKYCDVIVRRWQEFTGKEAVHNKTGKTFAEMSDG